MVKNHTLKTLNQTLNFLECVFPKLFHFFGEKKNRISSVTCKSTQNTYDDGADNDCCCWKIMEWAKVIGVAIMLSGVGGRTNAGELEEAD